MEPASQGPMDRPPSRMRLPRLPVAAARAVVLLLAAPVLALLAFTAFLALLPSLAGKAPAITLSPVEQALCVLDPDGSSGILVAGDSRAQYHLVPDILEQATGRRTVNVAQWLHLGGDPVSLVNALRNRPDVLAARPTVVLSVTIDALNDLGFKGIPMVNLFNWGVADHLEVLAERPKAYPRFIYGRMLPSLATLARNRWRGREFRCGPGIHRPPRLVAARGFRPYEGRKRTGFWRMPQIEEDYLLDGGQRKNLRSALDWLAASEAESIVLLNAPMDTAWLRASDGPVAMAMLARFSEMLAEEAARHPKVTYLDFFRNPLPALSDSLFYDPIHLNRAGAEVFSRHIGGLLAGTAR